MNLFPRKTEPEPAAEPPVTPADIIAAIERRRAALRAFAADCLAAHIQLEKAGHRLAERLEYKDLALRLMKAAELPALPSDEMPAPPRVQWLDQHRMAAELAFERLGDDVLQQRILLVAQVIASRKQDWLNEVRGLAEAIVTLRRRLKAMREFKAELRKLGSTRLHILAEEFDTGPVFGPPVVGDRIYTFVELCRREGIISEEEYADASK